MMTAATLSAKRRLQPGDGGAGILALTSKRSGLACAALLLAMAMLAAFNTFDSAGAQDPAVAIAQPGHAAPSPKRLGIGREAGPEEIAGWDIDVRPDGKGLPVGKGSVKQGEALFTRHCTACHGDFGEGVGRWPALAGPGDLTADRPMKTIGSYWPYASTLFDYVRRAQPFGNPQSLNNDELYAVVAYVLFLNDVVDQDFELTREAFATIRMPNEQGFHDDDRETAERAFWQSAPCMTQCKSEVRITGRARALDANPPAGSGHVGAE
jgi:cytochrome c